MTQAIWRYHGVGCPREGMKYGIWHSALGSWIFQRGTWKSVISRFVAYSFVRCYDHVLMYVEHVELGFS